MIPIQNVGFSISCSFNLHCCVVSDPESAATGSDQASETIAGRELTLLDRLTTPPEPVTSSLTEVQGSETSASQISTVSLVATTEEDSECMICYGPMKLRTAINCKCRRAYCNRC